MKRLWPLLLLLATPAFAATWYSRVDGANRDNPSNSVWAGCDGTVDQSYVAAGAAHPWVQWAPLTHYNTNDIIAIAGYSGATGYYWTATTGGTTQDRPGTASLFSGSGPVTDGTVTWTRGSAVPRGLHCAFIEPRFFYSDGTYTNNVGTPGYSWIGTGGDHYLIRGSIGTGNSYRIGPVWTNNTGSFCDANGCWGLAGDIQDSSMPAPPNGTSMAHTQILGENYAACTSATAKTQFHGGWGLYPIMDMRGAQYVDIQCLDLTDFSACGAAGQQVACDSTQDYARFGLYTDINTHDFTLTDVNTHGLANAGIQGPTGGNVVYNRVNIQGNAGAGFNADNGSGTTGLGSLLVENYNISWNGCAEEYPIVDPIPYGDCTDQDDGGYGDGFGTTTVTILPNGTASSAYSYQIPPYGTAPTTYALTDGSLPSGLSLSSSGLLSGTAPANGIYGHFTVTATDSLSNTTSLPYQLAVGPYPQGWQVHFDQGIVSYNTQDGLDALHIGGLGSTMTVTRTAAYSNMGQQIKVGGAAGTVQNNWITGNCNAMSHTITGRPSPTKDHLMDFCRANNVAIAMNVNAGTTLVFQGNTIFAQGNIALELNYNTGDLGSTNLMKYNDNIFLGYPNPLSDPVGLLPTPIFGDVDLNMLTNAGSSWTNNSYYNWRTGWSCPATGESSALCVDPNLTIPTIPDYGQNANIYPNSGSPVIGAGTAESGLTVDYYGATRPSLPSIGAAEPVGTPTAATPTFSPVAGTYTGAQTVTISTSTGGATLCYTVDGTTPTANGSGTCTHGTTYSTAVSVASSFTLKAAASKSGYLDSSVGSAAYVINAPPSGGTVTSGNIVASGSFVVQ